MTYGLVQQYLLVDADITKPEVCVSLALGTSGEWLGIFTGREKWGAVLVSGNIFANSTTL